MHVCVFAFAQCVRVNEIVFFTNLSGTGEGDFVDVHVLRDRRSSRRTVAGDHVHHTVRETCLTTADTFTSKCAQRYTS